MYKYIFQVVHIAASGDVGVSWLTAAIQQAETATCSARSHSHGPLISNLSTSGGE